MFDTIRNIAAELQKQMLPFSQKLIQCPSFGGEEGGVAELLMEEMRALGYDEVFSDKYGNVVGIIRGDEPGPNIMYNSHMDVVSPGEREKWGAFDPFGGEITTMLTAKVNPAEQEEVPVLMGRGGADMKANIASHVYAGALLNELRKRHGYTMRGDFVVASVVYEETGEMLGMIKLMDETFPERGITVHANICGEPSSLRLSLGHRGRVELVFRVNGVAGHGSTPWLGVNAINKAMKLVTEFEKAMDAEQKTDPDLGSTSYALCYIDCEPGGNATVPDICNLQYDIRITPQESPDEILARAQKVVDRLAAEDKDFRAVAAIRETERKMYTGSSVRIKNCKDAFKLDKKHPLAQECAAALQALGHDSDFFYWSFGTDAPVAHVLHKVASIGYSGTQEVYCHTPLERVRLDWLEKSLAANTAIYLKLTALNTEDLAL